MKKSTPIVQTPVSGKKRKCLTKLRTGSRIKKCASPRDTQPRTPSLTAAPTVVVTTTSSTSSEESAHINVLGQGLRAQRSTIILSPPLARASSLESVLSRQPRMSTSETPTNRPSKVRSSKTEPRFKIPVRTELDRSPSLEQVMTDSVVKFLCILFMFMCEKGIDVLISTGFLVPLNYSMYFLFEYRYIL